MAGKLEGKVAFITGAARGQGRSHAIRLAQEGANVIAVDLCRQIDSVAYPMATPDDLAETVKEVEALDRRIVAREADVRDEAGLKAAFDAGVAELGPVDIVLANAGIAPMALGEERHEAWQDVIDVNLTGVFNTVETAIPSMIERGQGGAIVLTSSTAGITGIGGPTRGGLGYTASKHGVVGLMRSYANTLAPHSIRVNSVHPTGVRTPMVVNEVMQQFLESDPAMGQAMANAARLAVPRPRRDASARRGVGELASVRYKGGSDDIDLDRTVEQLVEHPVPEEDDIIVRERVRTRRSVELLVDVSGSMRGERIRTAAATVGALAAELDRDDLAVVAFWSDAAILSRLGQHLPAQRLLDEMLRIPAKGLTNIAFPLEVAATELARIPARDARVVLLSDCVHNAGPDPRPLAARLARLDVLLDVSGEQDEDLARDLARLGHGRLRRIRAYTDVAPALSAIFAS